MKIFRFVDLFSGAGGTAFGLCRAARRLEMATDHAVINHNELAVAALKLNMPEAREFCNSVFKVRPRHAMPSGKADILWASPSCVHFSNSRAGVPKCEQERSGAECVIKFARALKPDFILVENVREFLSYGPLDEDGHPVKSLAGTFFQLWVSRITKLGYRVEWRELVAADYGDPTTRVRLIIQCVRIASGKRICWPKPLFMENGTPRWRCARDILDLDNIGTSIFRRSGKPLVANTIKRFEYGFVKQGMPPFLQHFMSTGRMPFRWELETTEVKEPVDSIVSTERGTSERAFRTSPRSTAQPLSTVTAHGQHHRLVSSVLLCSRGTSDSHIRSSVQDMDRPLSAVTTSGRHHQLMQPLLICRRGTSGAHIRSSSQDLDKPMRTIATHPHFDLTQAFLLGQQSCSAPRTLDKPAMTVTTAGAIRLCNSLHTTEADLEDPRLPDVWVNGVRAKLDVFTRMLTSIELGRAQGFPPGYKFLGRLEDVNKQIGNAVPPGMAEALALAVLTQSEDVSLMLKPLPGWTMFDPPEPVERMTVIP